MTTLATAISTPPESSRAFLGNSVQIGGVTITLRGNCADEIRLSAELMPFSNHDMAVEIQVSAKLCALEHYPGVPSFDSGALWKVFSSSDELVFDFVSEVLGNGPYKRLLVNSNFSSAQLLLNERLLRRNAPLFPLEYPTDELLITNYLASHRLGVEVHGCGIIDQESGGHLFLGHSGAGKSTTTRLWETFATPEILSDDRIILRLHDGELWMYGTPWHGEAAFACPGRAKLKRIFILQQGRKNAIKRLAPTKSVGEVFARCFPPFHSAAGLERTLEFLNHALDTVPCYEFESVADRSAVETVRKFHD